MKGYCIFSRCFAKQSLPIFEWKQHTSFLPIYQHTLSTHGLSFCTNITPSFIFGGEGYFMEHLWPFCHPIWKWSMLRVICDTRPSLWSFGTNHLPWIHVGHEEEVIWSQRSVFGKGEGSTTVLESSVSEGCKKASKWGVLYFNRLLRRKTSTNL